MTFAFVLVCVVAAVFAGLWLFTMLHMGKVYRERDEARYTASALYGQIEDVKRHHGAANTLSAKMVAERNAWETIAVAYARFDMWLEKKITTNEPTPETRDTYRKTLALFDAYAQEVLPTVKTSDVREGKYEPVKFAHGE